MLFIWLIALFLSIFVDSGHTIRCLQCLNCSTDWDTCDGRTCFVRRVGTIGNEHNQNALDRGCLFSQADVVFVHSSRLLCNTSAVHPQGIYITRYVCCNGSDLCNENLTVPYIYPSMTPTLTSTSPTSGTVPSHAVYVPIIVLLMAGLVVCAVILCLLKYKSWCRAVFKVSRRCQPVPPVNDQKCSNGMFGSEIDIYPVTISSGEVTCTSGSGSGMPYLVPRTFAHSITLGEPIGNGRFGQVYFGTYHGEEYAIKKFTSRDEESWHREYEIYTTINIRHDNILTCFATDILSNNGVTELWLITQFHRNGSLFDVLNAEVLSLRSAMNFAISTCRGIEYLHTELLLSGMQGKPAIAHRDIKSKNILVKEDGTCCLADFGLAVVKDSTSPHLGMTHNLRQGTKRYMAPEVLDETINTSHFRSFLRTDIYALGLVMWEIFRRCTTENGEAQHYEFPFQSLVPSDPSFEEMREIIVVQHHTPDIPQHWQTHELLKSVSILMGECWNHDPDIRPTAVFVKKKLEKIATCSGVKLGFARNSSMN